MKLDWRKEQQGDQIRIRRRYISGRSDLPSRSPRLANRRRRGALVSTLLLLQLKTVPLEAPRDVEISILSVDSSVTTFDLEFRTSRWVIYELLPDLSSDLSLRKEAEEER